MAITAVRQTSDTPDASNTLLRPCHRPETTFTYSPTHHLIALAASKTTVEIYRSNGERVYEIGIAGVSECEVVAIVWKEDGRSLAVAASDGRIRYVDVWSGKVIMTLPRSIIPAAQEGSTNSLSYLAWEHISLGYSPSDATATTWHKSKGARLETLPNELDDFSSAEHDLPRHLAMLDIERSLPKVTPLPHDAENSNMSSRAGIDATFHSLRTPQYQHLVIESALEKEIAHTTGLLAMGVLLAGFGAGQVRLWIFDTFDLGSIDLGNALPKKTRDLLASGHLEVTVECSASNTTTTKIVLLVSTAPRENSGLPTQDQLKKELYLLSLEFGFLRGPTLPNRLSNTMKDQSATASIDPPRSSYTIAVLVTKATQLDNCLDYLGRITSLIARDLQAAFDLPSRLLNIIFEALADAENVTLTTSSQKQEAILPSALDDGGSEKLERGQKIFESYVTQLLATGDCDPKLREWLIDQIGERNSKRWEKAVNDGLEGVRRGLEESILPTAERIMVICSRLKGIAGATGSQRDAPHISATSTSADLGLDQRLLQYLFDVVQCLAILAHDALKLVCEEMTAFRKWISWLKWTSELERCETDERREEVRDAGAEGMDWLALRDYLGNGLLGGRLILLLGNAKPLPASQSEGSLHWDPTSFFADFKISRQTGNALADISTLIHECQNTAKILFAGIAASLRKAVFVDNLTGKLPGSIDPAGLFQLHITDNAMEGVLFAQSREDLRRLHFPLSAKARDGHFTASSMNLEGEIAAGYRVLDFKMAGELLVLLDMGDGKKRRLIRRSREAWMSLADFDGKFCPAKMAIGRALCLLDEGYRRYNVYAEGFA